MSGKLFLTQLVIIFTYIYISSYGFSINLNLIEMCGHEIRVVFVSSVSRRRRKTIDNDGNGNSSGNEDDISYDDNGDNGERKQMNCVGGFLPFSNIYIHCIRSNKWLFKNNQNGPK